MSFGQIEKPELFKLAEQLAPSYPYSTWEIYNKLLKFWKLVDAKKPNQPKITMADAKTLLDASVALGR